MIALFVFSLAAVPVWAGGSLADIQLFIEDEVILAPASADLDAYNVVRGPDGAIWLNTGEPKPGLFRSKDQGRTWETVPVELSQAPPGQHLAGFHVARDGSLWLLHQAPPTHTVDGKSMEYKDRRVFFSKSTDGGRTWETREIDYGRFAPDPEANPYTSIDIAWCHPNFVERPDGSAFFSLSMRYDDWEDYSQEDQTRPGVRDVMVRTGDGGRTWGDPTIVHQHATETAYAVDPDDPDQIFAATRIQRKALPGEDLQAIRKLSAMDMTPPKYMPDWAYKNGILLESTDGGRSFREVSGGLFGFGSYRWSMVWTEDDWLILAGNAGQDPGQRKSHGDQVLRVSLNGGKTWLDGTESGTSTAAEAKKFPVVPGYRDVGKVDHYSASVPATIQIAKNRFLTFCTYKKDRILRGRFWRLENLP
jgi:hypothetical protein